jgi:hypothetical protein
MKLGTMASIAALVGATALGIVSGCDRGTAPLCDSSDSTCLTIREDPAATTGGDDGSSSDDGTGSDTVDGGIVGTSWDPVYDTGANIKTIAKADFLGIPSVPGGDARRIAFYVTDSTLHIAASSDGGNSATSNRETFYELSILCTDSIEFGWDSKTDNGLYPNAATGIDPLTVFETNPLRLAVLQMPVIANVLEAHLTARRGSIFKVWVKARSGYLLSGNAVATPEDSLPRLDIAETRALLFSGSALKSIPSDPFRLVIP